MEARVPRTSYLILLVLLLALSFSVACGGKTWTGSEKSTVANLQPSDCLPRCSYRCSATSHKKPCMQYCMQCCGTCLCVPPGTNGNRETCPCYNNWKTKRNTHKCP